MKGLEFPLTGEKVKGVSRKFDINSPSGRKKYFQAKIPREVESVRNYLKEGTFVAYMIGKKGSGKGTYSQIFSEVFGADKVVLISVGDLVRETVDNWTMFSKSKDYKRLKEIYRGFISFEDACDALLGKTQTKLLPTEFILALLKLRLEKFKGKSIFIDGLPREHDQVSYSLFFRDLIEYRDDPDVFVLIDIPEMVIDERIKGRVVCPSCRNSRHTKLNPTGSVGYDKKTKEYYLVCDNPNCKSKGRMEAKEGDELGIEPIRPRIQKEEEILRKIFGLYGVPKVLVRNHVPVKDAKKYFDDYEITPKFSFQWNGKKKRVETTQEPWVFSDDNGVKSHSLVAAPCVAGMVRQLADILA